MLQRVCSIALAVLSLSGCACLGKFPVKYVWELNPRAKVCGQYAIVSYDPKLQFKHVKDVPMDQCPAIFGFTSKDMPVVLDYADDALACSKSSCKK